MDIPIQGQYTADDFKKAMAVHLAMPRILAILIIIVLFLLVQISFYKADNFTSGFIASIPFLLMATLFTYPLLLPRLQEENLKKNPLVQHPMSGKVSDDAIRWTVDGIETVLAWEAVTQYQLVADLALLYQESGGFIPFPRHIFASDADWEQFSQQIQQHAPEKKNRRAKILFAVIAIFVILIALVNVVALFADATP
ncbi:MAG TPA: YcxB family protein [Caldilineae bacterium]|nr:YcxB family protein [Caldilineae bacterium]